jgi:serine/threonine protein kinase
MPIVSASAFPAPQALQQSLFPIYGGNQTRFISWNAIQATGVLKELSHLTFEKHLGEGASFVVGQYRDLSDSKKPVLVAVKTAKLSSESFLGSNQHDLYPLLREIQILHFRPLKEHTNIMTVLGMDWALGINGAPTPRLVVEFARHGTLSDFLKNSSLDLSAGAFISICLDIASGLGMIHRCGLIHGDLKLANLLVFEDDMGELVVKISDFGAVLSVFESSETQVYRGTLRYRAPELRKNAAALSPEDHRRCDIYAYGLCVWEILKCGHPYYEGLDYDPEEDSSNELVHAVRLINSFNDLLDQLDTSNSPILILDTTPIANASESLTESDIAKVFKIQLKGLYHDLGARCLCVIPSDRYDTTKVVKVLQAYVFFRLSVYPFLKVTRRLVTWGWLTRV